MKTPKEIIREMRATADKSRESRYLALAGDIEGWIAAIETAMREPVGVVEDVIIGASGAFGDHEIRKSRRARWLKNKPPVGTNLFAFPPDAAGEIERLKADMDAGAKDYCALMERYDAQHVEIVRLSHAVSLASSQKLPEEMDAESREFSDWQHGYEALVKLARAALAKEEDK